MTYPEAVISNTVISNTAAPLTLTLFGPMQVRAAGCPIPALRSRKSLWLLALLILRHGKPVERDWLAGTLWPDADQEQALASLRPALSELRKVLGKESERLLAPNRHTLQLDLAGADVDVAAFDAAIAAGSIPALERAVVLYRGPLLEGCPEEWIGQERMVREQNCLRALGILANAALTAGDEAAAVEHARRAVALDPWSDAARRSLMEALSQGGDTNAALQVYRDFLDVLRSDPKAVPDEKISALYQRLRKEARRRAVPAAAPETAALETLAPVVSGYLPHPLTDLVGREEERLEVAARLRRSRMVTLTGPGGIGKTRLAIEVAAEAVPEFPDGVWLAALEALTEGSQIERQVASVLGVKETSGQPLRETLTGYLRSKRLLLVLDNCEHLLDASAQFAGHLLRECMGVRLLATSRAALGLTGETVCPVPALAVPDTEHLPPGRETRGRVIAAYESVQLFVERAQSVQKTFSLMGDNALTVAQICARLGGMPLAIELAAARVKSLTVAQIASRTDDHLSLLTGGSRAASSRQQTLRATLDWSYALLTEAERSLLARLSVFAGGWSLEAAETVCSGDGIAAHQVLDLLTALVEKSLVVFEAGKTGGRYRLLETVRQYAVERLENSVGADSIKAQHRDWFLALAEQAHLEFDSTTQGTWLDRLEEEHDNLRAALDWCLADPQGVQAGLRMTGALLYFWKVRGHYSEAQQAFQRTLQRDGAGAATPARAKALNGAGIIAENQGDFDLSRSLQEESLTIFQHLGNKKGIAKAINNLGGIASARGDYSSARRLYEESLELSRELGDPEGIALALGNVGSEVRLLGDYGTARALLEESLDIRRELGGRTNIAMALSNLGNVVRLQGDYLAAQALIEESLNIRREIGDKKGIAYSLSFLSSVVCSLGDFPAAQDLTEESLSIRRELGDKSRVAWSLLNLGKIVCLQGDYGAARTLFEESHNLFRATNTQGGIAWVLSSLGEVKYRQGDFAAARKLQQESLRLFQQHKDQEGLASCLQILAAQSEGIRAACLGGAAEALRQAIGAPLPPYEQEEHERQVAQVRAALGDDAFTAAWQEGRTLTCEQAVAYALEEASLLS